MENVVIISALVVWLVGAVYYLDITRQDAVARTAYRDHDFESALLLVALAVFWPATMLLMIAAWVLRQILGGPGKE